MRHAGLLLVYYDRWFIASDGTGTSEEESPREMGSHDDDDGNVGPSETESPIASGGDGDSEETEDLAVAPASKRHRACGLLTFFTRPAEVQVTPGTQGGTAAAPEDHRAVDLASEDGATSAAHDADRLQLQRNIDGAQGGTVDCVAATSQAATSAPTKHKRKRMKRKKLTTDQRKKKRSEGQR